MLARSKPILVFTTAFRPFIGGSEIALEQIIKANSQFYFVVLTPKLRADLPSHEIQDHYEIYRLGWGSILDKYLFPVSGCAAALWLILKGPIRLAHSFQASYGGGAAWLFKLFCPRMPLIVTLQEGKDLENQSFFVHWTRALIIRRADVVTAISNYLLNYASKINPEAKLVWAPNGVAESFIRPSPADRSKKRKETTVVTVSRLVRKNGIDLALKAFKEFKILHPGALFLIIGSGREENNLKYLASELGISDSVSWLGEIPYESIPGRLAEGDIFIRLSRSEGLGTAFLEAMACGIPVIGTSVGGIPDFLKDGKTGLMVPPEDYTSAARAMNFLVSHESEKKALVENAKIMVREKYTWPVIARQFTEIYESY